MQPTAIRTLMMLLPLLPRNPLPAQWQRLWLLAGLLAGGTLFPSAAHALSQSDVNIQFATDPLLVVDSNYCSSNQGPRAAYVGFTVTNTSGTKLTDVKADLSGLTNGFTLAGGQALTQYVGTLEPGASRTVYWYVQYVMSCSGGGGSAPISSLMTITVADSNPGTATGSATVQTDSYISANAGGLVLSSLLGPGYIIGQTIPYDVEYEFGNTAVGDRFNLQPAGNLTYNAGCFQLTGSEVISSDMPNIPVGTRDRLFFQSTQKQTGSGHRARIRYFIRYLCAGVSTTASPYAAQTSGNTNKKYTGNYEDALTSIITFPEGSNAFTVEKTASTTTGIEPGDLITYTVTINNTSAYDASIDSIIDALPGGVEYVTLISGSDITETNSGGYPEAGSTGTVIWSGQPPTGYVITAGSSIQLVYGVRALDLPGYHENQVTVMVGETPVGAASAGIIIGLAADLELTKTVGNAVPALGDQIIFTVTLTNAGPDNATNIQVQDILPAGLTEIAVVPDTGTYSGGIWTVPSLANTATATLTMVTEVTTTAPVTNTAEVIAADQLDPDSTPNNQIVAEDDIAAVVVTPTTVSSDPNLLLVKRLTAINATDVSGFVDGVNVPASPNYIPAPYDTHDNDPLWPDPNVYLRGAIYGGDVQPGDELEYTIYFLSNGDSEAENVWLCDAVPTNTTFVADAFTGRSPQDAGGLSNAAMGIALGFDATTLPQVPTHYLTNAADGDRAMYFPPGNQPTVPCFDPTATNSTGVVAVNLTPGGGSLPAAQTAGSPTNAYGFFRFRARVQ